MDAVGLRQFVDFDIGLGHFQRPGQVVDVATVESAVLVCCVEAVAFGKEAFKSALCAGLCEAAVGGAKADLFECEQARALVVEFAAVLRINVHVRPEVGEPEKGASGEYGSRVGGIERKEEDAGEIGMALAHVGAEVELRKAVCAGNQGHAVKPNAVHPEGSDADPGGAVECVHGKAGRDEVRDVGSRDGPMGEKQVVPALGHGPCSGREGPGAVAGGGEDLLYAGLIMDGESFRLVPLFQRQMSYSGSQHA